MASFNRAKTHCKRGHPFDAENTHVRPDGSRSCRTCAREYKRTHPQYRNPEREQTWRAANRERVRGYNRSARRRNRKPCRRCGGTMPFPSPGAKYCSPGCLRASRIEQGRAHRQRASQQLASYKIARGCSRCGYRICAAALHFHHRDPALKEFRLTAAQFASQSPRVLAEIAKCVLLCANCHFEAHHLA